MMIGDILDGGVEIIDMESKIQALKAMWIPRLLTTKHIVKEYLAFAKDKKLIFNT